MTPEMAGVYWFACSLIYAEGGPVGLDDDRWRGLRIRKDRLFSILSQLEVKRKLTISQSKVSQKRCISELDRANNRITSAVTNGLLGGRPKENSHLEKPPGSVLGSSPEKLTTNQQPSTSSTTAQKSVNIDDAVARCCAEAGCREDVNGTDTIRLVRWLKLYDLENFILPTIRRKRAEMEASGRPPPRSLKFFDHMLPDAAAAQARASMNELPRSPASPQQPRKTMAEALATLNLQSITDRTNNA